MLDEPPAAEKAAYHHGNLREALLAAVGEIIREKGVGALSLREAARRAGVSHSAPAHHFGDKLGMLTAFAIQGFEVFRAQMQEALDSHGDAHSGLDALGIQYVTFALEEPEWFDVMFRSELHDKQDPELLNAAFAAFGVLTDAVKTYCSAFDEEMDAELLAIGSWSKVHGLAMLYRDGALSLFVEDDIFQMLRRLMEFDSPFEL